MIKGVEGAEQLPSQTQQLCLSKQTQIGILIAVSVQTFSTAYNHHSHERNRVYVALEVAEVEVQGKECPYCGQRRAFDRQLGSKMQIPMLHVETLITNGITTPTATIIKI